MALRVLEGSPEFPRPRLVVLPSVSRPEAKPKKVSPLTGRSRLRWSQYVDPEVLAQAARFKTEARYNVQRSTREDQWPMLGRVLAEFSGSYGRLPDCTRLLTAISQESTKEPSAAQLNNGKVLHRGDIGRIGSYTRITSNSEFPGLYQ